jgi:hypothetical protein
MYGATPHMSLWFENHSSASTLIINGTEANFVAVLMLASHAVVSPIFL